MILFTPALSFALSIIGTGKAAIEQEGRKGFISDKNLGHNATCIFSKVDIVQANCFANKLRRCITGLYRKGFLCLALAANFGCVDTINTDFRFNHHAGPRPSNDGQSVTIVNRNNFSGYNQFTIHSMNIG